MHSLCNTHTHTNHPHATQQAGTRQWLSIERGRTPVTRRARQDVKPSVFRLCSSRVLLKKEKKKKQEKKKERKCLCSQAGTGLAHLGLVRETRGRVSQSQTRPWRRQADILKSDIIIARSNSRVKNVSSKFVKKKSFETLLFFCRRLFFLFSL